MRLSTNKILSVLLHSLILFIPLIFIPGVFNPYESSKFVFFAALVFILFLFNIKKIIGRVTSSKMDNLTKLVLIYGIVVYFADLLGIDPRTSFVGSAIRHQGFLTLLAGICLFLVVRYNNYKYYKSYISAILLGAFFVSIFSFWQGIAFYVFHDLSIPTYQGRIVGTMGNPNSLAGYLVMILPFVFAIRHKSIKIFFAALIIIVIVFTDSRSGFLVIGILLFVYILRFFLKLNIQKTIKVFIAILFAVGLIGFADYTLHKNTYPNPPAIVKERGCPESWPTSYPLKIISDLYSSKIFHSGREALCDNRFLFWVVGLETVAKRPILGYGQENFEIAVPAGKMHNADNAHNIFLEIAISSGLVGLVIFIGILFVAFKKANFTIRLSLLAFLIAASFNPLSIAQIGLFWFLLGISESSN